MNLLCVLKENCPALASNTMKETYKVSNSNELCHVTLSVNLGTPPASRHQDFQANDSPLFEN